MADRKCPTCGGPWDGKPQKKPKPPVTTSQIRVEDHSIWYLEDGEFAGGYVGQEIYKKTHAKKLAKAISKEDKTYYAIELAAQDVVRLIPPSRATFGSLSWESNAKAREAMRAIIARANEILDEMERRTAQQSDATAKEATCSTSE